jgi:hypothetical protein
MARAALTFRQADITRAVRAVTKAGISIARVEVDKTGKIVVVAGEPGKNPTAADRNEWDDE